MRPIDMPNTRAIIGSYPVSVRQVVYNWFKRGLTVAVIILIENEPLYRAIQSDYQSAKENLHTQ